MRPTRSPYVVAALVLAAGASTAVHLGVDPGPFAPSSASVLALGVVLFTTLSLVGLLLPRGRWSRRLALLLVLGELALVAAIGFGIWGWTTAVFGVAAVIGLLGRWLDGWVRPRPAAAGPDPHAVLILLGLLAYVPAVGLADPSGLDAGHGVLGAAAVLLAWAYAKAQAWSLWTLRFALVPIAVPAILASPWGGALLLIGLTGAVAWLAWSRQALLSVRPLPDTLPRPRPRRPTEESDR